MIVHNLKFSNTHYY